MKRANACPVTLREPSGFTSNRGLAGSALLLYHRPGVVAVPDGEGHAGLAPAGVAALMFLPPRPRMSSVPRTVDQATSSAVYRLGLPRGPGLGA